MAHEVRMPKPGQMTEECTLTAWFKGEGDPVRRGDVLFEIETDKSAMEVEAFDEGVLLRRLVEAGATVPVNTICGYIGQPGEAVPDAPAVAPAPVAPAAPTTAPPPPSPPLPSVTPSAVLPSSGTADGVTARLAISPRAARLAAGGGLDPRGVAGSGPGGRIVERDVRAALAAVTAPAPAPVPAAATDVRSGDEDEAQPLGRMRRVIAERLTRSWTTTPHFTVTTAVDVTWLLALRGELKAAGTDLTVTDFVLAAVAGTLAEFPAVNSRTDGVAVWTRRRVHLGVAVALPGGLVVPVIRDADRLGLAEIAARARDLAAAARAGTLAPDQLSGSTFTVSNLGMFGVDAFTAIINPGEAAILAVGSAVPTPVVVGGAIVVREVMKLTISADHRMIDGETAARFLGALRRTLEDAEAFRREIRTG